jgi:hypothetical protein
MRFRVYRHAQTKTLGPTPECRPIAPKFIRTIVLEPLWSPCRHARPRAAREFGDFACLACELRESALSSLWNQDEI